MIKTKINFNIYYIFFFISLLIFSFSSKGLLFALYLSSLFYFYKKKKYNFLHILTGATLLFFLPVLKLYSLLIIQMSLSLTILLGINKFLVDNLKKPIFKLISILIYFLVISGSSSHISKLIKFYDINFLYINLIIIVANTCSFLYLIKNFYWNQNFFSLLMPSIKKTITVTILSKFAIFF